MENKATELNASIRRTIEQLAHETDTARQSQLFRDYLRTSAAFWDYSWHNQMLIWRQRPDASFVGGFHTWLKCGRFVRKGEKGIAILAPMFFKDKRQKPEGGEDEIQRIWFKVVYVFDISQTDGTPLPELPTKSVGERGQEMLSRLLHFAESRGIAVRFVERCTLNGAAGTSQATKSRSERRTLIFRRKPPHWPTKSRIRSCIGTLRAGRSPLAMARRSTGARGN
jgi:hypothetical protein